MSLPWQVQNMHEDIYEECLAEARKNMIGYFPHEIQAAADLLFEEKLEALGD
jgi:hypothetical protein